MMSIYEMVAAILPLKKGRKKMSRIECPICRNAGEVTVRIEQAGKEFEFLGLISCRERHNGVRNRHSFPSRFVAGVGRGQDIGILPAPHTVDALGARVESAGNQTVRAILGGKRKDLIQDIDEAGTAKRWSCTNQVRSCAAVLFKSRSLRVF